MIEKLKARTGTTADPNEPRVHRIDSESATTTLKAISSDTARMILSQLHREPLPPSKLAESLDTSIPTVNYHLENLVEAGLVEQADTWYSEKGREMSVYAPANDPLVFVGTEERTDRVQSLLTRIAGVFVLLLGASVVAQWFVTNTLLALRAPARLRKAAAASTAEGITLTPIPPGFLFFAGGTFVLASVLLFRYVRAKRKIQPRE